jgi:hypothetical protein
MPNRLVEVDWLTPLGFFDVIQSLLVEHPHSYYLMQNQQCLFYLTRSHGLLKMIDDFSGMTHEDLQEYILDVLLKLG